MKQLLVFLLLLCSASVSAQDVIVKKDGSTIVCHVVELTDSEITYKKWSDLNGSNYVMNRADASAINYENGKKVSLSETTNLFTPNNQNDGVQQYNDRMLMKIDKIDKASFITPKGTKTLRTIGFIGGGLGIAGGIYALLLDGGTDTVIAAVGSFVGGAVWTSGFLLAANLYKKAYNNRQQGFSLYNHRIDFSNGSNLTAGIDMLHDRNNSNHTLGIGLRYNF